MGGPNKARDGKRVRCESCKRELVNPSMNERFETARGFQWLHDDCAARQGATPVKKRITCAKTKGPRKKVSDG